VSPNNPHLRARKGSKGLLGSKTGKDYETNAPSFKGDKPGAGIDERKEKEINEEKKANIPNVPKEGKNEVDDPEKEMGKNQIEENDPRKRKSQL
jgi:hypothetical protein